ncbi:helix-turn-helix transcriptional regulator [Chengkuizengella axinellae]|uniref:WYL domain-containing protein n=1 Tax=Chengkuizengella axinellae TaxID=3064388 RepID=A0ABT9IU29_9BACL|nr:WYL domain-containing protein [Chengkuizengella sp. 2205SS18-9]MDP5272861.1 hypothetical protein [Chengkuizengella sp. 2205SS18-9]
MNKYPNSKSLAEKFEISTRQAHRDIEYMTSSMRAPLRYVAKHRGYEYTDDTYILPNIYLTEEEREVLQFLSYRYEQVNISNTGKNVSRLSHLFRQLSGIQSEPEQSIERLPMFEYNSVLLQMLSILTTAIKEKKMVELILQDGNRIETVVGYPTRLMYRYGEDYLFMNVSVEKEKQFPLKNISKVHVRQENEQDIPGLTGEIQNRVIGNNHSIQRKPFLARIKLKEQLKEESWYGFHAKKVDENHVYEIQFFDHDAFLSLLFEKEWKSIESPRWLKEQLQQRCSNILKKL